MGLGFGALWLMLWGAGPDLWGEVERLLRNTLTLAGSPALGPGDLAQAFQQAGQALCRLLWPFLAALGGTATLGLLLPPRFRPPLGRASATLRASGPDPLGVLLTLSWSGVRVVVLGVLLLGLVPQVAPGLRSLPLHPRVEPLAQALWGLTHGLLGRAAVGLALLSPLGFWLARHVQRRALRMSEDEIRREQRADFGDPRMRRVVRRRQRPPA